MSPSACPCGLGPPYDACCGALHAGGAARRVTAATAERLMRSRYCAFAVGDERYLLATWHPSTRPQPPVVDGRIRWRGLEVVRVSEAGDAGTVEFVARLWNDVGLEHGELRETSRFVREDGHWFYVAPVAGG